MNIRTCNYLLMNIGEKKLISIFKTFIDKVFVPQLPKMDLACQKEWKKFSNLLASDQINYGELQLYVNTLQEPSPSTSYQIPDKGRNKSPLNFMKSKKDNPVSNDQSFNPSKTFGGQRARLMFPLKDMDDERAPKYALGKEQPKEKDQNSFTGITNETMLPILDRLFASFTKNHTQLQRVMYSPGSNHVKFGTNGTN